MKSRQLLALLLAVAVLTGVASSALLQRGKTAPTMTSAADAFLKTLSADEKALVVMKYDDPERVGWHFIPKPFEGPKARKGLTLKSMNEKTRAAALKLVSTGLSESGFQKTKQVMELEGILAKIEGPKPDRAWTRDPEMYYFTVFGKPGIGRWGWRCEGHHLSLNFVIEGDKLVSATPSFYGANPGEVPEGEHKGLRILEQREDVARAILKACDKEQKKAAHLSDKAPDEIRAAGKPQPVVTAAEGLAAGKMSDSQKKMLRVLLESYAQTMAPEIAARWLGDLDKAGFDKVYFGWWGGTERGERHHYRVQGPTFIIEYNNTQNGANHIHSIWRDTSGDMAVPLAKS